MATYLPQRDARRRPGKYIRDTQDGAQEGPIPPYFCLKVAVYRVGSAGVTMVCRAPRPSDQALNTYCRPSRDCGGAYTFRLARSQDRSVRGALNLWPFT